MCASERERARESVRERYREVQYFFQDLLFSQNVVALCMSVKG